MTERPQKYMTQELTGGEKRAGFIYLPLHIFAVPLLLGIFAYVSPGALTDIQMNSVYYLLGVIFVLVFMRRFLREGFNLFMDNKARSLLSMVSAYMMDLLLSYVALMATLTFIGDVGNPNDAAVGDLVETGFSSVFALTVFAGPLVEEVLFRGVVFGSIRPRNRILAYAVSILLFSVYHIWQYFLVSPDPAIFLYAIQYIPVSIALAWCYERSGTIWAPIFFHMISNALAMYYYI